VGLRGNGSYIFIYSGVSNRRKEVVNY
jgi:hypothetical protein